MQWYPVFLDLRGRDVLVVGEGAAAREKVDGLERAGAKVALVAAEEFTPGDLEGKLLVVAAADERAGARVAAAAADAGVFCNVADVPRHCSFILPAIHREGPITVAVSTGGASPALAQWLRARIAELVRPEHARLAERLAALRPWAKENLPSYEARRDYFRAIVEREAAGRQEREIA